MMHALSSSSFEGEKTPSFTVQPCMVFIHPYHRAWIATFLSRCFGAREKFMIWTCTKKITQKIISIFS
jgi:hypothetical protein